MTDRSSGASLRGLLSRASALAACLALAACGGDDGGDSASTQGGGSNVTADNWSLAAAAAPYKGTELRILDEVTDLQPSFQPLIAQFEKETGIKVSYELEGHLDVIRKGETDLLSGRGAYDGVMIHSTQKGRVLAADAVTPIDEFLKDEKLKDPNVNFDDFIQPLADRLTLYDGKRIAFPNWNYNTVWWGRKDLMEHPDEKAAFKERFGRELAPPKTLQEMVDFAQFFTRKKGEKLAGETLDRDFAGFVKEGAQAGAAFGDVRYTFMNQFGGDFWDESGKPNINTPENVEAMKLYQELWKYSPPGQAEMSLIDVPVVMGEGRAASGLVYSDFLFSVDAEGKSQHAGQFTYAPVPPKSEGDSNWTVATEPSMIIISKQSENPEAMFLFLQWMVSKSTQDAWFEGGIGMPVRKDSLEHPTVTGGDRAEMFEAVKGSLEHGDAFPVVPKLFEIIDEVNKMQQAVGQGQDPAAALAQTQSKLEEICGDSCVVGGT
ncbi:MAG TPA: extracellular solute-binding protein [Solirubrobacter sp.]|nr:extracellular solute-binding protein [Solirubrobacter sp.]